MCIALCTIVAHNIAQNRPDNFPSYPPDNHGHQCSDDVYLREGGPEGSILGPLLFLKIYINDLSDLYNQQDACTRTDEWLLRLNTDKCKTVLYYFKNLICTVLTSTSTSHTCTYTAVRYCSIARSSSWHLYWTKKTKKYLKRCFT